MLIRRRFLTSPQEARMRASQHWKYGTAVLPNAGWHFSCMQDPAGIILKLQSFSHQECNIPKFTDVQEITQKIKYGLDLVDRTDYFWCCVPPDNTLPSYVQRHPEKFKEFVVDFEEFHVNRLLLLYRLQEQLRTSQDECARLKKELSEVQTELGNVVASISWKVTEPLRQMTRFARRHVPWIQCQ